MACHLDASCQQYLRTVAHKRWVSSPYQPLAFSVGTICSVDLLLELAPASILCSCPCSFHTIINDASKFVDLIPFSSFLGEIDIMEARGNGPSYPNQYVLFPFLSNFHRIYPPQIVSLIFVPLFQSDMNRGSNYVRGSLNWGPLTWLNAVYKTFGWWSIRRGSYDEAFHTYVLEWDKDFMYVFFSFPLFKDALPILFYFHFLSQRRIYVDTRLHHLLELKMNIPFFQRGEFPGVVQNGSEAIILENPWSGGSTSAPFDQCQFPSHCLCIEASRCLRGCFVLLPLYHVAFYLILNVAVGGTNGWFPDGPEKPWLDGSMSQSFFSLFF